MGGCKSKLEAQETEYSDVRGRLATGDIVLFNRENALLKNEENEYTNYGIVIIDKELDVVFVAEASTSTTTPKNIEEKKCALSVTIRPLSTRLYHGMNKVASIRLLGCKRDEKTLTKLAAYLKDARRKRDLVDIPAVTTEEGVYENREDLAAAFTETFINDALKACGCEPDAPLTHANIGGLVLKVGGKPSTPPIKIKLEKGEGFEPQIPREMTEEVKEGYKYQNYDQVRGTLKTGDVVLFSGTTIASWLIKRSQNADFSHCGIVVKSDVVDALMLYESSTNKANIRNVEDNKINLGIEMLALSEKVFCGVYNQIAFRSLQGVNEEEFKTAFKAFRTEMRGKTYETSYIELVKSAIDLPGKFFLNKEDLSSLFCSEMVTALFKEAKILDPETNASEVTPHDFSEKSGDKLKFINDCSLAEEVRLVM